MGPGPVDDGPGLLDLGPAELARARRLGPGRRAQYVTGRALLRRLCALAGGGRPGDWRFNAEGLPRPVHIGGRPSPWLSLAHSGEWILGAASDRPGVGVDLEARGQRRDWAGLGRLLRRWRLGPRPAARRGGEGAFLRDWTRYEAAYKAAASLRVAGAADQAALQLWDLEGGAFTASLVAPAGRVPRWLCIGPRTRLRAWRGAGRPQAVDVTGLDG